MDGPYCRSSGRPFVPCGGHDIWPRNYRAARHHSPPTGDISAKQNRLAQIPGLYIERRRGRRKCPWAGKTITVGNRGRAGPNRAKVATIAGPNGATATAATRHRIGSVSGGTGSRYLGYSARPKPRDSSDADWKWEKYAIYAASMDRPPRHHGCGGPANCPPGRFTAALH